MHISLTDNLEAVVKSKVESGLYNNASEVIRDALRIMLKTEEAEKSAYAEFKRQVLLGHAQATRGEFSKLTPEEIAAGVRERSGVQD